MQDVFDKNIFLDVVKSNIESFSNRIFNDAQTKAIRTGNPIMTEAETRDLARYYFSSCVAKFLAERISM